MPSVSSPSDGGYQYYQRKVSELEDEIDEAAKRTKENERERTEALERNYRSAIAKRDREIEETAQEIRENAHDSVQRDREGSKSEIDKLKSQLYDRQGRIVAEAEESRHRMDDLVSANQGQEEKTHSLLQGMKEINERRLEQVHRDNQEQIEKSVNAAREAAMAAYGRGLEEGQQEYYDFRKQMTDRYAALDRARLDEFRLERERTERALQDSERDYDHRARSQQDRTENRLLAQERKHMAQLEKHTHNLNQSHDRDTRVLRDTIKDLLDAESLYLKEKGQGTSEAYHQVENQFRTQNRVLEEGYQQQIAKMKQQAAERDSYFSHQNTQNLREKDAYFATLISKQNADNELMRKQMSKDFERGFEQVQKQMHEEKATSKRNLENDLREASRARDTALEKQAEAFQESMRRQKTADQETIDALHHELHEKNTSEKTSVIAPAAEAKLRRAVINEYEKSFDEEKNRNKRSTESLLSEYSTRLRDTVVDSEKKQTQTRQQLEAERHLERSVLMEHIRDTEFMKDSALHNKEIDTDRQFEKIHRSHADALERQRREYEEILQTLKDNSTARIVSARQEAEFNAKMAQRAFAARQNELNREYEKKLADQKQDYEARLEELKAQASQELREGDRKNRLALEEQARSYEQRLAQLEFTHKERERYVAQNYQEELEKVKRSNALLIQKKS